MHPPYEKWDDSSDIAIPVGGFQVIPGQEDSMTDFKPDRDSAIKAYDLDDEVMLYGSGGELVHSLNASAKKIWELCDGTRTVEQICEHLAASLGVQPEDLMSDIQSAIEGFLSAGLLETPES